MSGSALSDLSGLVALAQQRELDLRPVILRVQTDLFVTAPARDRAMIEAFEALSCGLLRTVDDETAAIVARKLAPLEDTPEPVLQALASPPPRRIRGSRVTRRPGAAAASRCGRCSRARSPSRHRSWKSQPRSG